ncbi:arylsulfatase [Moorena sp. SIO3B2]|uniref:arylsulfatase n=1 Tax=Moorena sp. SIO3B2 TaxID=2607827 RepID=UPI00258066AB|nr:arylsulfatase [Moorena sp. SIO3B2]
MRRILKSGIALVISLMLFLSGLLPWLPTAPAFAEETTTPNIIVIMADDVGWFNLSAYNDGMMGYRTPNIDRIAEEGIRFTDAYAENSCTAGRAAFITGQSPGRTGLTKVGLPGSDLGLSTEDITLAEILKEQGYATGQFGKNHLGDRDEFLPTNHGFEEFYGNLYHLNSEEEPENPDYPGGIDGDYVKKYGPKGVLHSYDTRVEGAPQTVAEAKELHDSLVPEHFCIDDASLSYKVDELDEDDPDFEGPVGHQVICNTGPLDTDRMPTVDEEFQGVAEAFMEKAVNNKKPFFVWLNPSRMHVYTHLKEESQGVTGQGLFADGMVENDNMVGELLDELDELGVADNTIVIYTADNGAQFYKWPDGGTIPFHGEKNTNWEGGFRVPFLVRWPARWKGGVVSNDIISMLDWLPTLASATGIEDLQDIKTELLNPCLEEDPPTEVTCDGTELPVVYEANDRDFHPLHLDGYNFLPRLDYLDNINRLKLLLRNLKITKLPVEELCDQEPRVEALCELSVEAPRHEMFYLTDDAYPSALRYDDWKLIFAEQREKGAKVWSEPFIKLRIPLIINLRRDPFERAPEESSYYDIWKTNHAFIIPPSQAYVDKFLNTFRDYPPRQFPASFTIDGQLQDLLDDLEKMRLDD